MVKSLNFWVLEEIGNEAPEQVSLATWPAWPCGLSTSALSMQYSFKLRYSYLKSKAGDELDMPVQTAFMNVWEVRHPNGYFIALSTVEYICTMHNGLIHNTDL